jgi:3-isopropylmalate/(R)-2-methylmalate dehydratase small subunit
MEPFKLVTSTAAPLDRVNVDTDAIIPKQFLKRIERTGFGQFLFYEWRFDEEGNVNPSFELNKSRYQGSEILIGRNNFGCGSSREHAPWALLDYGFRVVIAPSFADIFFNNCFKNGILPIVLPEETVDQLFKKIDAEEGYRLTVDLENNTISDEHGLSIPFQVDAYRRECLLKGLDDIGISLMQKDKIADYEANYPSYYAVAAK